MLLELLAENYAVIERVRVAFYPGLNVLSGETGSGKSIVVDALGLLFGARASSEAIRSGAPAARVSGIFEASPATAEALRAAGIEVENGEILIEREILPSGKSRAFISSRPVTVSLLRQLAPLLGDIHGQHDQQQLFSRDSQLDLLDRFAGTEMLRDEAAARYSEWRSCIQELEELDRSAQEQVRLLDVWTYQMREIESASLQAGEDEELENERRVLQNTGKLMELANHSYSALYDAPESAHTLLRSAVKRLEELSRIDSSLQAALDGANAAAISAAEAAAALRDYLGRLEADPSRLEEVESRLAAIHKLKRKYGASIPEVLAFLDGLRTQISGAESSSVRRAQLEKLRQTAAAGFEKAAADLRAKRSQAGTKLEQRVQTELASLGMGGTRFVAAVRDAPWSASGMDSVEFLISANAGEEPKPLDRIASGGEISRLALALKTCVNERSQVARTLVFDEVDAGIGGSAAEAVGKRLKGIAEKNQVLCVTHLAQIAGFADHHFSVSKREAGGRTVASVEELTGDARTREIGRMLSGQHLTPEALKHAKQLIRPDAAG